MARIKPIPQKESEYFVIDDLYLLNVQSYPQMLFHLYDAMVYLKEDSAVLLYMHLLSVAKTHKKGRLNFRYPRSKIHDNLGWSNDKITKARNTLKEYRLITFRRLKVTKGYENPTVTSMTHPSHIDWKYTLSVLKTKNPNNPHISAILNEWSPIFGHRKSDRINNYTKYSYSSSLHERSKTTAHEANNKTTEIRKSSKQSYDCLDDIPKKYKTQIKRLRFTMHNLMPNSYPSVKIKDKDMIDQANGLRITEKQDKLDWDTVLQPALKFAMTDKFWLQNLRSYSTLRNKWKNNETKAMNLIAQWESQNLSIKPKTPKFDITKHYTDKWDKKQFNKLAEMANANNGSLKQFHDNIQTLKTYWDSIPETNYREYTTQFFYNHWDFIETYIDFLKDIFPNFNLKLLNPSKPLFLQFVSQEVPKRTASYFKMGVKNGKFTYA